MTMNSSALHRIHRDHHHCISMKTYFLTCKRVHNNIPITPTTDEHQLHWENSRTIYELLSCQTQGQNQQEKKSVKKTISLLLGNYPHHHHYSISVWHVLHCSSELIILQYKTQGTRNLNQHHHVHGGKTNMQKKQVWVGLFVTSLLIPGIFLQFP